MGYTERKAIYRKIEKQIGQPIIVYVTGDRKGFETQIATDVLDYFGNHLDKIITGPSKKISFYLYTRGGNTLAAWSIVNLLKQYFSSYEVIIPSKALSAGTLICLGASKIIMSKKATLGPIDPNINTPLNPPLPNNPNQTMPVSVEAIKGFIELVKSEFGVVDSNTLSSIITALLDKVHPIVLGEVYRARAQIKMIADKLLDSQQKNKLIKKQIIEFLCSESGSHDYTINVKEAKDLGLRVSEPDENLSKLISELFQDIQSDLELGIDFDPVSKVKTKTSSSYANKRAIIESTNGGSDYFITEGIISKVDTPPSFKINDQRIFEGWKHE